MSSGVEVAPVAGLVAAQAVLEGVPGDAAGGVGGHDDLAAREFRVIR